MALSPREEREQRELIISYAQRAVNWGLVPVPVDMSLKRPYLVRWQETEMPDALRRVIREVEASKPGKKYRADGIGILTGAKSGVVVLDVDDPAAWDSIKGERELEPTFTVLTPSGGFHLYFLYDSSVTDLINSNRINGLKVDFRTNGGVIMFAGNRNPEGGEYRVLWPEDINERAELPVTPMPLWLSSYIRDYQEGIKRPRGRKRLP